MAEKKPYDIVKVISGGRVIIPEGLRKLFKINDGDHMAVYYNHEEGSFKYVSVEFLTRDGKKLSELFNKK